MTTSPESQENNKMPERKAQIQNISSRLENNKSETKSQPKKLSQKDKRSIIALFKEFKGNSTMRQAMRDNLQSKYGEENIGYILHKLEEIESSEIREAGVANILGVLNLDPDKKDLNNPIRSYEEGNAETFFAKKNKKEEEKLNKIMNMLEVHMKKNNERVRKIQEKIDKKRAAKAADTTPIDSPDSTLDETKDTETENDFVFVEDLSTLSDEELAEYVARLEELSKKETSDSVLEAAAENIEIDPGSLEDFEPTYDNSKESKITYLKNQMIKKLSGLKFSPAIGATLDTAFEKIRKNTAIATLFIGTSFVIQPDQPQTKLQGKSLTEISTDILDSTKDILSTKLVRATEIAEARKEFLTDHASRIQLSSLGQEYYDAMLAYDSPYVMLEKDSAMLYFFNTKNICVAKMPALFGAAKGESANRGEDNPTTPMGVYGLEPIGKDDVNFDLYEGKALRLTNEEGTDLALHPFFPLERKKREAAWKTRKIEDNTLSDGCINIPPETWDENSEVGNIEDYTTMIIVPDQSSGYHMTDAKNFVVKQIDPPDNLPQ